MRSPSTRQLFPSSLSSTACAVSAHTWATISKGLPTLEICGKYTQVDWPGFWFRVTSRVEAAAGSFRAICGGLLVAVRQE